MSTTAPYVRFCSQCGQAAEPQDLACRRCGRTLTLPPPPASRAPGGRGSGIPGWVLGMIGCVIAAPFLTVVLGILAAIAIPNFLKYQTRAKSQTAHANLQAIWAAQQSWAAANGGEYLEFYVDPTDQSDPNWIALNVSVPRIHHTYEAYFDGENLWITAYGDVDGDSFEDEWELASIDGVPDHYKDDADDSERSPRFPVEDGQEPLGGGVVGGLVGGDPASTAEMAEFQAALERVKQRERIATRAQTASANLETIWRGQLAYKKGHRNYVTFDDGGAATWAALKIELPEPVEHRYAAVLEEGELVVTAVGNLDDDAFVDTWRIDPRNGRALHLRNDALDLDLTEMFPAGTTPEPAKRIGQAR